MSGDGNGSPAAGNRAPRLPVLLAVLMAATFLVACGPTPGTTYYVSPAGSDTAAGTSPSTAWRTITRANGADLEPGDSVLFQGGAAFAGTVSLVAGDSGTSTNPVTIGSYNGTATISPGSGPGVIAYDAGGITMRDFRLAGSGPTTNAGNGIAFYNDLSGDVLLAGVNITDVDVSGFGQWGVSIGGGAGRSGYRDVRMERVQAHNNASGGILTWGSAVAVNRNVYVGYSSTYSNLGRPGATTNTGSGIVMGSVDGGTVEHSRSYANGGSNDYPSEGPGALWAYDSNRVTIQFNEAYDTHTGTGTDGEAFNLDQNTSNSVIQYNYSHGNDGAGLLLAQPFDTAAHTGNVIRYNLSYDDTRRGGQSAALELWGPVRNAEVYQNTVYLPGPFAPDQRAVKVWTSLSGLNDSYHLHVRNNVFVALGGAPLLEVSAGQLDGSVDLLFQGNDWFSASSPRWIWGSTSSYSLPAWRAATGQEQLNASAVGLNADPLLVNPAAASSGLQLRSTSPAVDAGVDLAALGVAGGGRDYYGGSAPLGSAPDIGAHELR